MRPEKCNRLAAIANLVTARRDIWGRFIFTPQDFQDSAGSSFTVDATAAINAAIATAAATRGIAYVPKGAYGISGTGLLIYEASRIELHPEAVLRRLTVGEIWRNWVAGGSYAGRRAAGNWVISGGVFDAQGASLGAGTTYSIANICQAKNIKFDGCVFQDVYAGHCIDTAGVQNMLVNRCTFRKFTVTPGREFSEAIQLDIMSDLGVPSGMNSSSYDGTPCDGVLVRDCFFDGFPTAIGSHGYGIGGFTGYYFTNISVLDCVCENMSYESIRPQRWKRFKVSGIRASGNSGRAFIRVDGSTDFIISDFHWKGTTVAQPIQATPNPLASDPMVNWRIQDGVIDGSGSHGVLLYRVSNGTVKNLRVRNVQGNGVVLYGCRKMVLDEVDVRNVGPASAGIRVYRGGEKNIVNKPKISGVYSIGILVEGSAADCVVDEFIVRELASARIGIRIATSTRTKVQNGKLSGAGGTGVDVTTGASGACVNGTDFRGLRGSNKIVIARGVTTQNSNNRI